MGQEGEERGEVICPEKEEEEYEWDWQSEDDGEGKHRVRDDRAQ